MTKFDNLANHANIQELATKLGLNENACSRALQLAELAPDSDEWLRYISRFMLTIGALLIVAGVAAFFAWNWADLDQLVKFALIQAGIAGSALLTWRLGMDSTGGGAALFSTAFLVGVLFAVFGQVYQTGADPYGLFVVWAVLILPLAFIGRQAALWILLQTLLNLALIMYWTQVIDPPNGWWQLSQLLGPLVWLSSTLMDSTLASLVFALNAIALAAWEYAASRNIAWMRGRTYPRVIGFGALINILVPTVVFVIGASFEEINKIGIISPALYVAASVAALYYYRFRRPDLLMLTMLVFGAIMVFTTLVGRHMPMNTGTILIIAILLVAQVAGAAYWLRQVSRQWEAAL
ncbi:MAG: DUF2157 domain-containing protein [Gammaproteobacteria bacterium]